MADEKISVLTLIDAIADGDYGVVIDDPLGTPVTKRYTFTQLATYMNTALSLGNMSQQSTTNYYNKTDADEAARDVVGTALTDGTGIDIVVNDGANTITVSVNQSELNAFTGDAGAGGVKGVVPAPASGDAAAGKFLKADGTWAVPAGGGGGSGISIGLATGLAYSTYF